jgi:hypothetical protein
MNTRRNWKLDGFGHERFASRHSGRDHRLTDVAGNVLNGVPA